MHPPKTLWQDQQTENTIVPNKFSPHLQSRKQKCHCVEKT
jgi:hypothetical protein